MRSILKNSMPGNKSCGACGKFISATGGAVCNKCNGIYHKQCVALGTNSPKNWACPCCTVKLPRRDNTDTPVKSICDVSPEEADPSPNTNLATSTEIRNTDQLETSWQNELVAKIRALRIETKSLRKEISTLATGIAELKEDLFKCKSDIIAVNETVSTLEKRLNSIESYKESHTSNAQLEQTINELRKELSHKDQLLLSSELEIVGVPEINNENPIHLVKAIATKIGINLVDHDIAAAFRSGPRHIVADSSENAKRRPRSVVVRLVRRPVRDCLLQAARVRRSLTSTDLDFPGPHSKIYLNERLTKHNKTLLRLTKEEARRLKWKFVWTRNGQVLARKDEGETVHRIADHQDLHQVFNVPGIDKNSP